MKFLILAAALVCSTTVLEAQAAPRETCNVPDVENIDIDDVLRLTSAPCFFTLERLVTSLPERMRDTAIFISESQSLFRKCIDPESPRIIYHTPRVIIAVPWRAASDVACQKVEVIGMSKANQASLNPTLINFQKHLKHIDTSGVSCIACHTNQFQPIWNSYPYWAGAGFKTYGFKDDNIVYGSVEYQNFKKFVKGAEQLKKMNWFGPRVSAFLSNLSNIDDQAQKFALNRDWSVYGYLELFKFPFTVNFSAIPDDRAHVRGYSRSPRDRSDSLNRSFGIEINRLNAKRLANDVIAKLGAEAVRREFSTVDFCKVNAITRPRVFDKAATELLQKLKSLLERAGLDPDQFMWASPLADHAADEVYDDGEFYSDQAFLDELLIELGLHEVNFTEFFDPPPQRGPFYHASSNQYSAPDHLFNSCENLPALLFNK